MCYEGLSVAPEVAQMSCIEKMANDEIDYVAEVIFHISFAIWRNLP